MLIMKESFDCPVHQVVRVVDGDTQKLLLDLGFATYVSVTTRVRGIDCPEMSTMPGRLVKTVVAEWIDRVVRVGQFNLRWVSCEVDMYGRTLGDFYDRSNPEDRLSSYMLFHGIAKTFHEKRVPWTAAELDVVRDKCVELLQ
jgi:endonuclease YncB( thermonuclease family)